MTTSDHVLQVYRDLADWHERQGLDQLRDRFLVLAAAAAHAAGQAEEGERLRQRLLRGNPQHPLRPFTSFGQALHSTKVQAQIEDLRQEYPLPAAEDLLNSLRANSPPPPRRSASRVLPPTAPVIDLGNDALKVYRLNDADSDQVPVLPAWNEPAPRPASRKTSMPSPRSSHLHLGPGSSRAATVPVHRATTRVDIPRPSEKPAGKASEEQEEPSGAWVSLALFLLVLIGALTLAWLVLVQPFLT
jgi:hypothetical protein